MSFDFLEIATEFQRKETEFVDAMINVGLGDYVDLGWDACDGSLELYEVDRDHLTLTPEQQKVIYDHGFVKAYVNYKDGKAAVYTFGTAKGFQASRAWPAGHKGKKAA